MRIIVLFSCSIFVAAVQELQEEVQVDLVEAYISALNSSAIQSRVLSETNYFEREKKWNNAGNIFFAFCLDFESQIPLTIAIG